MLAEFRFALRHFLSFSEAEAAEVGLAPQQYQALLAVTGLSVGDAGVTINALARTLLIKHNSAVGLVDRLEDEGLIVRRTDATDRRKVNLHLTARGGRVFAKLAKAHRAELNRIGPQLADYLAYFAKAPGKLKRPGVRKAARGSSRRGTARAR